MKHYDNYIFDLDGTLLDTLTDLAASVNYALRSHNKPEHPEQRKAEPAASNPDLERSCTPFLHSA